MTARSRPRRPAAQDGFILVAVLWILAALATLAGIYATYVSSSAMAAATREEDILARGLAAGAVELVAYRLIATPKPERPAAGEMALRRGRAEIRALFRDESARLDLNAASKEMIAGLFVALGAKPEAAADHAAAVIGWRTASPGGGDELPEAYRAGGLDYGPRGSAYVHPDELWRVPGLPADLVARAMPFLTVYSGRSEVRASAASPLVLAALPGPAADRASAPAQEAPPTPPGTTTEPGESLRVFVRVRFDSGRSRTAEAVVLLRDFGTDPFRILFWRDDAPAPEMLPPPPRVEPRR